MDKEALLSALDKRREDLTGELRDIGSRENEAIEAFTREVLNQTSDQPQTMEEYRNDHRAAIRGQLRENACTRSFVDCGLWVDAR